MKKQKFLLYDDSCSRCGNLAQLVEKVAEGQLVSLSMTDPEMKRLVASVRSDPKWEPMLVTVKRDRVRVYSGARMVLCLGISLGPVRTFRILTAAT